MTARARRFAARIALATLAAGSLVAVGVPGASAGPGPSGVFDVPAGHTMTIVKPYLTACNELAWGYVIEGQNPVVVDEFPGGCGDETFDDQTLGPFAGATSVRLFLTDVSCAATFYSDGTPVDHAVVTGANPWHVEIADAQIYPDCVNKDQPAEGGNFAADVRVDPVMVVTKVVAGDDPGVAFPITVSCTAAGVIPKSIDATADPEIVLDGPDTTDSVVVELANGESESIPLVIHSPYIDSVTCTTSESLAAVTLPAGFTCATPAVDHPEVVWENGEWSATPVTVTNTCTRAANVVVELQPAFTG